MTAQAKGGALARLAGMWCGNPEFWAFLAHRFGGPVANAGQAAEIVRGVCNVASRAELDNVPAAEAHFHACIRLPWVRWQQGARNQHQYGGNRE